jgi:hypothetical protein
MTEQTPSEPPARFSGPGLVRLALGLGILLVVAAGVWWLMDSVNHRSPWRVGLSGVLLVWLLIYILPEVLAQQDGRWFSDPKLSDEERVKAKNETRSALLPVLSGAAVILTVLIAMDTLDLDRRKEDIERQSKYADRYAKAVEMLSTSGNDSTLDVRVGAVYALEQLAKDNQEQGDSVVDVLAAYVRAHSTRPTPQGPSKLPPEPPSADIQAAIGALGRYSRQSVDRPYDLRGVDLRAADLSGLLLLGARLTDAKLGYSNLTKTDLTRADLSWADLIGRTSLQDTVLSGASFFGTRFESVDLRPIKGVQPSQLAAARLDATTKRPKVIPAVDEPEKLTNSPKAGQEVTITSPRSGDVDVTVSPPIVGTYTNIDSSLETLWLVTVVHVGQTRLYFPQGVSYPDYRSGINRPKAAQSGRWCSERGYLGDVADKGRTVDLLVVGANQAADQMFTRYLAYSAARDDFPPWSYLPSGVTIYARSTVTRGADTKENVAKQDAEHLKTCPAVA